MKKILSIVFLVSLLLCQTAVNAQLDYEGVLLISEIGYDTPGNDSLEEWFELVNTSNAALKLDDIRVGDEEKSGGNEGMFRFPEGAIIQPEQVVLIAQTASGFRKLFGFNPNYELKESDTAVPNMRRSLLWATGDFALGNNGDELLLLQGNRIIDAVNYEERETFFAPSVAEAFRGQSIERYPVNCDTDSAADWQTAVLPNPGLVVFEEKCQEPINPALLEALPTIGQLQGNQERSPFENQVVTFRGVVTGFHEDTNASGITFYTIFVQDLVGFEDGEPDTSDGIGVFLGRERPFYEIGDQLRISGQVTEFFGLTEIDDDNLQIWSESTEQLLPLPIDLGSISPRDFEAYEGMLVALDEGWVVSPHFQSCGFFVHPDKITRFFVRGDEAMVVERPFSILNYQEAVCDPMPPLKFGDKVEHLVGPLTYHFDEYKMVLQEKTTVIVESAPIPSIPPVHQNGEDEIAIASFNLQNHFDSIDDTGINAEPKVEQEDIEVREAKIAYAIKNWLNCPAVLGIQEVENEALLQNLAERIQADCGFLYQVVHKESADSRGIDVALMVNANQIEVIETALLQTCTSVPTKVVDPSLECSTNHYPLFSRPPLLVKVQIDGKLFYFLINHFKSKRGGESETAVQRHAQADFVNQWVREQLAQTLQSNIIVMGDFNDFEASETMQRLTANGNLTNALLSIPDEKRYSFSFGGSYQLIDGILLSPNLVETAVATDIIHVNADFPFQYQTMVNEASLPFRSSDHDLPIVWLKLTAEPAQSIPTPTAETLILETAVSPEVTAIPPISTLTSQPSRWAKRLLIFGILVAGMAAFWHFRR